MANPTGTINADQDHTGRLVTKSNPTAAQDAATKSYADSVGSSGSVSDTAFASSWNGVTTVGPSKNALYDWAHTFDTDDDGKVNVLDMGVGIVQSDSGGVVSAVTVGSGLSFTGGTLSATGSGSGTVTTTGSPATGNLAKFSGATSITNGDLTGAVTTSGTLATTITNGAVTYAKVQNVSANSKLLGSSATGGGAPPSEIILGTNLSMSGSTLNAAGGGGGVSDGVYPTSWNGDTTIAPSRNAVYDYLHLIDTDDDGKINVLDQGAGITNTDSSGVIQTALTAPAGTIVGTSDTQTLTNKRVNPRVDASTSASATTWAPNSDTTDIFELAGALSVAVTTISNPSGTPVDGQKLIIRLKDNGTARALTWSGSQWRASSDLPLPTTTILSKTLYLGFIWNSADTKWDLLALLNNF